MMRGIFLFLLCSVAVSQAAVRYVAKNNNATRDGNSFATAYWHLQPAIDSAVAGDEIWVKSGTYTSASAGYKAVQLKSGVKIYGGFSGTETSLAERNLSGAPSILAWSGAGETNLIRAYSCDANTLLDGFEITGGFSGYDGSQYAIEYKAGGGIFISGGAPKFKNLVIRDNRGTLGAAVYAQNAVVSFTQCEFRDNGATNSKIGGAIYAGASGLTLTDCTFTNNRADLAAGAIYLATNGNIHQFTRCEFSGNTTQSPSGAGVIQDIGSQSLQLTLSHCRFFDNNRTAISVNPNQMSNVAMEHCSFRPLATSTPQVASQVSAVEFTTNRNSGNTQMPVLNIDDCSFEGFRGGAAGACSVTDAQVSVSRSRFYGNQGQTGGALVLTKCQSSVSHSLFVGNTSPASNATGAIALTGSTPGSGGLLIAEHLTMVDNPGGDIGVNPISGSFVQGNSSALLTGFGPPTDPRFVRAPNAGDGNWLTLGDNDYGVLELTSGSTLIDASGSSSAAEDLLGNPRSIGVRADRGAYEYIGGDFAPNLSFSADEDMALSFTPTIAVPSGEVLDPQSFSVESVTAHGAFVLNPDDSITFTPSADETSQVKIFYRYRYVSGLVSDLGEITIDITPINDAPTFTASNVSLRGAATDGLVELDNWLENPSVSGGDDEASQTLSTSVAIVGKSDTIQFITPPAVLANGRLSFEAATGSQGICEIAVTLSDNGGTANGGIDSITQNYTLRFGVVLANPLASGTNNGDSWDNAFTSFASAVANAQVGEQVWLAEGRYPCNGATLKNQVEIYGGFTPSMFSLGERDWNTHRAILTGDLGGDDIDTDGNGIAESASDFVGGNSQRVIVTNGLQRSAVLDGATITAASGNFGSSPLLGAGGGIVCDFNSSPTLRNLDVVGNRGNWGGGLAVFSGNPLLVNCQFRNNVAGDGLGNAIVFLGYSNPARGQLVNCRFLKNGSSGSVIGHTNGGGSVGLTQCEFFGFPANGTMVYHNGSSTASFAFSQCTFVGNGNQWFSGSALSNIERSILSGFATNGETLNSCLVTGAVVDGTQIVSNQPPAFLDQDGPDNLLGTPDDDFSLSPSSPALDWFAPTVLPADIADLDGDADMAESIPLDIAGQPRVDIYGKRLVDLGAREFTLANAEVDVDKDGLPDGFEFAYSGSRTGLAPTSDLDNDRANALLEFFRGTSPSHADVPNAGVETSYGGLEGLEGNWLTYTVLQDPRSKDYVGGGPKIRDDLSNLGLAIIPVGMVSSSSETAVGIYHTLRFRPDLQAQDKLFIRYEVNRINVGDPEE